MPRMNPYERLKREFLRYVSAAMYRHTATMWHYPKDKLSDGWNLSDLYERTAAAEQVGYDVVLRAKEHGLVVCYVKKLPPEPMI